jgi:hypothetical protein
MTHREDIGRELEGLSKEVAGLPVALPYSVPPGYFEQFPEKMLELIRLSEEGLEESLPMHLAGLRDQVPFQVPAGYFEGLPERMLAHVRFEELKEKPTFRVPVGYFEELPEKLLRAATAGETVEEELGRLSPLLSSLPREYPGSVPAGYFETFQATREERTAPVVRLIPRNSRQSIRSLLAAAVTLGAILLSAVWGYYTYDQPVAFRSGINLKTTAQFNSALAKISDQTILEYLKDNTDVSDADLAATESDDPGSETQAPQQ